MPLEIPQIPVFELLKKTAEDSPSKPFILHPVRMTFKELDILTDKIATALAEFGIKKGDIVALFMWNSPEFIISFFGVLKAGATVTALNPSSREGEAKHQLEDSESVAVIVEDVNYPIVKNIKGELPKLKEVIVAGKKEYLRTHSFVRLIEKYPPSPPKVKIDPMEDLAVIQYASSTKGLPRGCMLTHHNLVSNIIQISLTPGLVTQDDVTLALLPFYHIYGMTTLILLSTHRSVSLVLERRFILEEFLDLIQRYRVTTLFTVMPIITLLTEYPKFVKKYDLSSIRYVNNGAVPILPELARKFEELTGVTVTNAYGLSETSPVTHANPLDRIKLESVGPPVAGTEQKIVDLETGTKELPLGKVGEIVVKGPQVMKGYWKRPEETAEVLKDGWLYTGDIGKIDEDGYLYITDRKKEIIKFKGFTVGPVELESVLLEHPAVGECAVVGKPDLVGGEIPKAFVVLKPAARATKEEIIKFVNDRVAGYKRLREVEFVHMISKAPDGRVLRRGFIERERAQADIR